MIVYSECVPITAVTALNSSIVIFGAILATGCIIDETTAHNHSK